MLAKSTLIFPFLLFQVLKYMRSYSKSMPEVLENCETITLFHPKFENNQERSGFSQCQWLNFKDEEEDHEDNEAEKVESVKQSSYKISPLSYLRP